MADPTTSQTSAKEKNVKEGLLETCVTKSDGFYISNQFSEAIQYGKLGLGYCYELGKEEEAKQLHSILCSSYLSLSEKCMKEKNCIEDALENGKQALEHCKKLDNKKLIITVHLTLAQLFLLLEDFGEALINGAESLSYFEENDDINQKLPIQHTMALAYYSRALNSLNNKQFKEASDDGEKALVCYEHDKSFTIQIRWLLAKAYFSQEDFKNALKQFDGDADMLSQACNAEDYITAGNMHMTVQRYDEAKIYFEKAKKEANKKDTELIKTANKLIWEANKLINDEALPQMLKDLGEKDIGKQGKKSEKIVATTKGNNKKKNKDLNLSKNIEEQTFCDTEKIIEKEACGDGCELHVEDIIKEHSEVLDAEETLSFAEENGILKYRICKTNDKSRIYKGYIKWTVPIKEDEWEEKETCCSVLEVDNENTARHHHYISNIFGVAAVKVHAVNGRFVVLEEIAYNFLDWYSTIYKSYKGQREIKGDWWNHIECDVRKLFGGLIKSLSKLYPDYSHGNVMGGIAVFNGQAKLFNMKHPGIEGYKKDIDCLHYMISNVVVGVPPKEFKGLDDDYHVHKRKLCCSKELKTFLQFLDRRKYETINIYTPFFWTQDQQIYFLESVYDVFWKDMNCLKDARRTDIILLEACFHSWAWSSSIPSQGPFRKVFKYNMDHGGQAQLNDIPNAYSIAFWRHCKTHYNDYIASGEKRRTVEEINIELNKTFGILDRVFRAVCIFTKHHKEPKHRDIFERLVTLRDMPAM